ncbi:hypothetical protein EVAR_24788_1 [Eumeta japonica]|uniref:Uncharacterized protein n=1 Tax=Eumeta variegata TaxID=151549 RepID=A0A4C1W439_EUMVA|nr:hypothetical protein EVAR_24788_1 [Eumeta japonica]
MDGWSRALPSNRKIQNYNPDEGQINRRVLRLSKMKLFASCLGGLLSSSAADTVAGIDTLNMSSTSTRDHGTNENLSESSCGRERIEEEIDNLHTDTRSDRGDAPSAASAPAATHGPLAANMRNSSA